MKFALLDRALKKSIKTSESAGEHFSPAQFAKELNDMESRLNVFFPKGERQALEGMKVYMEAVKRSGQYAANPPTGNRIAQGAIMMGGPAALFMEPASATAAASSIYGIRGLLRTETGKNLMLRLGAVSPASKQAQDIVQQLNSMAQRSAASEASRQSKTQNQQSQGQRR